MNNVFIEVNYENSITALRLYILKIITFKKVVKMAHTETITK